MTHAKSQVTTATVAAMIKPPLQFPVLQQWEGEQYGAEDVLLSKIFCIIISTHFCNIFVFFF
jgi:hypothetical protein